MDAIKDIVAQVIKDIAAQRRLEGTKIERLWENVCDPADARHTKIKGLKNDVLWVDVESPVWLYSLNIKKRKILERLREEVDEIKNIRFKIGKVT